MANLPKSGRGPFGVMQPATFRRDRRKRRSCAPNHGGTLRLRGPIGPVGANEETIPIPHLRVIASGDQIGVANVALSGADGLGRERGEVGGEAGEQRGIWRGCGP